MPANKSASIRYRIIDQCLRSKGRPYPSKEDIQEEMAERIGYVSMSTIDKDFNAMRFDMELGFEAPIKYSKIHKGYHYEDPEYSIEKIPLSSSEMENIQLALHTLDQYRDIPMFKEVDQAIGKILNLMKLNKLEGEEKEQDYIAFESTPRAQGTEWLEELYAAILERKEVVLDYHSFKHKQSKDYTLHPYLLKEYRGRWYVLGHSPEREAIITFGLDRIEGVESTGEEFKRQTNFNSGEFFKHSLGITVDHQLKPTEIELKVAANAAQYLKSQSLHPSQEILKEDEEFMLVKIEVIPTYEFYALILSHGDQIQIMKPKWIRDEMRRWLERGLKAYSKSS